MNARNGTDPGPRSRMLTLDDIADLRAYERDRDTYRRTVIELKRRRRVPVGSIVSLVFENRETMRAQIQEMARAEKMVSDDQIQKELDVYNALIPDPGELSATLFIELTGEDALRNWLPRLVGIEHSVVLGLPDGDRVRAVPEAAHADALTRPEITASVHYIRFGFTPAQIEAFAAGPVTLAVDHPEYRAESVLSDEVRTELLTDLRP
ncbi:MAG TPA: DUF3501 family protein [Acidimicrobiales bacterium]|nr:DUF3501 family protein [Acidimicrobiales bacterium]